MKRQFNFLWTLRHQCSLQTAHFKKFEQQNQISKGSPCPTLKPSISSSPLFAKSSTISRAKKPICRQQLDCQQQSVYQTCHSSELENTHHASPAVPPLCLLHEPKGWRVDFWGLAGRGHALHTAQKRFMPAEGSSAGAFSKRMTLSARSLLMLGTTKRQLACGIMCTAGQLLLLRQQVSLDRPCSQHFWQTCQTKSCLLAA